MSKFRTGDCFDSAYEFMINPANAHLDMVLVHGLPTGQSGNAKKVGQYPHAWIELPLWGIVHDTLTGVTVPMDKYYITGEIEYVVKYKKKDVFTQMRRHVTYGPWDEKILARDDEIDAMIEANGWN